jgi:hypothetical protein
MTAGTTDDKVGTSSTVQKPDPDSALLWGIKAPALLMMNCKTLIPKGVPKPIVIRK